MVPKSLPATKRIGGFLMRRAGRHDWFDYSVHVRDRKRDLLLRVVSSGPGYYQAQLTLIHNGVKRVTLVDAKTGDNAVGWAIQTLIPSRLYDALRKAGKVNDAD